MRSLLFLLPFLLLACDDVNLRSKDEHTGKRKEISYSYACLDSAFAGKKSNKNISRASDLIRDLAFRNDSITDQVQTEYGAAFHQDAIDSKTFELWKDAAVQSTLDKTMQDLLAAREHPSKIEYHIYALQDTAINAFTFGGRIYVTRAMYERCQDNPALLYAIVGHEIGHSEMGHIKKTIEEMILAQDIFGQKNGTAAFQLKKLLTSSFNQKNELEADYYGTDLTFQLNQDLCAAVSFWYDMAKLENQYNVVEDFFRTHPFSNLRAQCLKDHIQQNFGVKCVAKPR